jgi:hypothetical protein
MQRLQHAEERVLQGLAAHEVCLGVEPLIPLQIHLSRESPTLELGGEIMHEQLDALLLASWQAIETTAGFQIDHGLQPLVTLEGEAGAQAWISGSTLSRSQMARVGAMGSTSNWPSARERSMKRMGNSREERMSALRQSRPCSGR